jgi:hypothetical protein
MKDSDYRCLEQSETWSPRHQTESTNSMSDRTVVFRANPNSETSDKVAARLRAGGVEIVEEQPNMLLVTGAEQTISKALGEAEGWSLSTETKVSPPSTQQTILKPPSK